MNTQEIFWTIAIITLLIIAVLVIMALYYLYRFIKILKQEVKGVFDSKMIKEIIETVTGKGSAAPAHEIMAGFVQFMEGYCIGIKEFLQSAVDYCYIHLENNEMVLRIELFIELANSLDEIKEQGNFFLVPPDAENRKHRILFQETPEKEQQNEARD